MKSLRPHFEQTLPYDAPGDTALPNNLNDKPEVSNDITGEYRRSYNALNAALISIFELIYLPQQVLELRDEKGKLYDPTQAHLTLQQMKEQFHVFGDYDGKGLLALQIKPVTAGTHKKDISPETKNIRDAITTFYSELNEYAAGLPGLEIDPIYHNIIVSNPRSYLALMETLCAEKGIVTSEQAHTTYALRHGDPEEGLKPGHYNHPAISPLPDIDQQAGARFRKAAHGRNPLSEIPEPVFKSLAARPLGYREIGHLINDYQQKAVYPLLSLLALEAIVEQDMQKTPVLAKMSAFNLH